MRRLVLVLVPILAVGVIARPVHAQRLEAGRWLGSMTPPEALEPFRISYEVSYEGDAMRIVVMGGDRSLDLNEARFEGGNLVYWFQPGPRVDCVLKPDGKDTYAGDCSDTNGDTGQMMITRDESRVAGLRSVEELEDDE